MRKLIAFLTAGVFFFAAVLGFHQYQTTHGKVDFEEFATWTSEAKYLSHSAIEQNMDVHTLPVFGSSELEHGQDTPYHPEQIFKGKDIHPMLIGAGYYQSLSHAITLAAIDDSMENRKAVLIVAPQWFRKSGVKPEAFSSRFSETNFVAMLKNPNLSVQTKEAITKRTIELLKADPPTQERVESYGAVLSGKQIGWMDAVYLKLHMLFMEEKSLFRVVSQLPLQGISSRPEKENLSLEQPDWNALCAQAEIDGEKVTQSNPFYVWDRYYQKHLEPELEQRKGSGVDSSYCTSPEYDDLRLFLQVCKELKIQPMLVNVPVNGWWYDYTQFPKEDRQQYYENIREIAAEYGAQVADFSTEEYTPYFLEDTIHLGWKGWVEVSEAIYQFAKQD